MTGRPDDFWRPLDEIELPLVRALEDARGGPGLRSAADTLTRAGEHGAVWLALALAGAVFGGSRRRRWRMAGVAVANAYVVDIALKLVLRRRRPPAGDVDTSTQLSFPSAHAATSAAASVAMRGLVPRAILWPLTVAIPASRLYFGVHYPSDILAGTVVGRIVARATLRRWPRANKG